NDEGIIITASKGQDNITLVAGANHDIIEFTAGGGKTAAAEIYEIDLGNLRLGKNQSFTIDGVTITNISDGILNTFDIAQALETYVKNGFSLGTAAFATASVVANLTASGSTMTDYVSITGKLELGAGWASASGAIDIVNVLDGTNATNKITITSNKQANLTDLNFTFDGNGNAAVPDRLAADVSIGRYKDFAKVNGATASGGNLTDNAFVFGNVATGTTAFFSIDINGESFQIKIVASSTTAATASALGTAIKNILSGASGGTAANATIYINNEEVTATAKFTQFTEALGEDFIFTQGSDGTKLVVAVNNILTSAGGSITMNTIGSTADTVAVYDLLPKLDETTNGKIVIDFGQGLLAGQSYTFNGKSVVATRDLTGAEVAEAFTFGAGESFDGAAIVGTWSAAITDSKILFGIDGSKLTIIDNFTPTAASTASSLGIKPTADDFLTGTGALAVNTNRVTASTTQQGVGSGETIFADSYVVFSASDLGSAGAGSAAGTAANIKLVTSALDTITNFDIANDKLLLNKLDGSKFVASDRASGGSSVDSGIYVDTAGNKLSLSIANGIVDFSAGNAAADAITLDQKVYAAWSAVDGQSGGVVAGFEHGGDFYLIATGGQSSSSTDDLVVKLAGVTGITDVGAILA
ncbi:MAG: hypothetical protein K2N54_06310, partial [Helicobacter sp.]|nr:hypothetical protein [Helicobacter sp.]